MPEQYLWVHRRFKGLSSDYPDYYGRDSRNPKPSDAAAAPTPRVIRLPTLRKATIADIPALMR